MARGPQRRAQSLYRQVRLTFTQELNAQLSYSLYAKGLNQAWDEHQCLIRDRVNFVGPLESTEDVVRALIAILSEQLLPESHNN